MNGLKLGVPVSDDLGFRFQVDAAVFHGLLADHVDQDGDVPRSGMTPVDDKIGVHV